MEGTMSSTAMPLDPRSNGRENDPIEVRFMELCKSVLYMEGKACTEAVNLFKETKRVMLSNISTVGNGTPEEVERYWSAFVLYSVKRLSEIAGDKEQQPSHDRELTLCQILRSAKLNFLDFFRELPQFVVKAGPVLSNIYGADWVKRLEVKELQANFVHLSTLSRHYKRAYLELFLINDANGDKELAVPSDNISSASEYLRFGWLLFLSLRVHALSRVKDLVTCINGLVSVLAILIVHLPVRFRKFSLKDDGWFAKGGERGVDLLASLCQKYDTPKDDLKEMMKKTNGLIVKILKGKPQMASQCKSESLLDIDTEGLIYYEHLMDESSLKTSLNTLEKDYDEAIRMNCQLDERVFINEDDSLLCSGSLSGTANSITEMKRKFDSISSPTRTVSSTLSPRRSPAPHANGSLSGANSIIAPTPVSTAMITAKWLRTVVSPLPPNPSPQLEKFLASCDRDVTNEVVRRAQIILEATFPSSATGECCVSGNPQTTNLMDSIWAEQRRLEALKLYYRVLEAMCTAEAQILHATNLTSLLTNERFHRCMLACSAELVLATHKTVTMLFPAVLERTGITAFDLSKVIESFIRHEESLPRELRRHLNSLEERLLESLVWEKGSSLYNSLIVARPAHSAEVSRLGLLPEPMPSLDTIAMHMNLSSVGSQSVHSIQKHETSVGQNEDMRSPKRPCITDYRSVLVERKSFMSPVKDRLLALGNLKSKLPPPALQSAFASPTRPSPGGGGETCAETGINIFFGKINKLAAVRINGMVEKLQQSHQHIRENAYRLFQQVLTQRTSLFFNRHIDQILLCCLYGIAKISRVNLTFKEIIYNYRKQPQCKPHVFRSVFVDWSSARHNGKTGQDHVDIITFYNEIFVPAAKAMLLDVGPAGKTATKANDQASEVYSNKNGPGQCPTSPKVAQFPNLPDMSPKKVSGAHNVYVSPLRTSKMDALISSPSPRSYYACVGESTRAYQSPSKDLAAINNRLNGNRKAKVSLVFDHGDDAAAGLVSDSMVANTLNFQNENCESPSPATPIL